MPVDHATLAEAPPFDRDDPAEQALAALVRDAYDADLRDRVSDGVDRQLAVFFAIQAVPSRAIRHAA
jgi:hypothetical protein